MTCRSWLPQLDHDEELDGLLHHRDVVPIDGPIYRPKNRLTAVENVAQHPGCPREDSMSISDTDHDLLSLLLEICPDFFSHTSQAAREEVNTLLHTRGSGWLIDILGLT